MDEKDRWIGLARRNPTVRDSVPERVVVPPGGKRHSKVSKDRHKVTHYNLISVGNTPFNRIHRETVHLI